MKPVTKTLKIELTVEEFTPGSDDDVDYPDFDELLDLLQERAEEKLGDSTRWTIESWKIVDANIAQDESFESSFVYEVKLVGVPASYRVAFDDEIRSFEIKVCPGGEKTKVRAIEQYRSELIKAISFKAYNLRY